MMEQNGISNKNMKFISKILFFLSLSIFCTASNIPITNLGVSNTQAVFKYDSTVTNACTFNVIDSNSGIINDVNSTLFPGSNIDNRNGSLDYGKLRIIVIGEKNSDKANDGKLYSRALQADSLYTLTVTCGSDIGTLKFKTKTIPLGNSSPNPYPYNTDGYGNYGYPTVDYSDLTKTYIDPETGILLKRMTSPGYGSPQIHSDIFPLYSYTVNSSTSWINIQNLLSNDSQYATFSGSGGINDALFIPTPMAEAQRAYINFQENYIDDILIKIRGFGNQTNSIDRAVNVCITIDAGQTCTGNTLTLVLPQTTAGDITGPNNFATPFFDGWGSPNIQIPSFTADFSSAATMSANGTTVINTTPLLVGLFAYSFPDVLKSGDRIKIAGSNPTCPNNDCTISSYIDPQHITLSQNLGSGFTGFSTTLSSGISSEATSITLTNTTGLIKNYAVTPIWIITIGSDNIRCTGLTGNTLSGCTGVNNTHNSGDTVTSNSFILNNFGFKIWKQSGTGSISLDSVKYSYGSSADYNVGFEGEGLICSGSTVTSTYAADGTTVLTTPLQGKTCIISDKWTNPFLWFFAPSTGEMRPIARLSADGVTQDTTNPLKFYQYNASTGIISDCMYDSVNGRFRSLPLDYNVSTNPYLTCGTNLTPGSGNDVISQIQTKYPQIDMSYFGHPQFVSILGNIATFELQGIQNGLTWGCYFDMTQPSGSQLKSCTNSWDTWPLRWGGIHGGFGNRTTDGWLTWSLAGTLNAPNTADIGEYTVDINKIYNNSNLTSLSPTFTDPLTCEQLGVIDARWLQAGATGNNCIKINISREPVNKNPNTLDLTSLPTGGTRPKAWIHNSVACGGDGTTANCWGYLQPIEEGDWLRDLADLNLPLNGERFLVAKKTTLVDGSIDLVLSRAASANPIPYCVGDKESHTSGFSLLVDLPYGCNGNEYWTNVNDSTKTIYADNPAAYAAHTNLTYDANSKVFTQWTPNAISLGGFGADYGFGYGVRHGNVPSFFSKSNDFGLGSGYTFSGNQFGTLLLQTHPGDLITYNTNGNEFQFGLDGRPFGGGGGGQTLAWNHSYTLVGGTTHVYKVSLPLQVPNGSPITETGVERKKMETYAWYAHTLLKDISGPGSTITDSDLDSYCVADLPGECVPGSSKDDEYVSILNPDISAQSCLVQMTDRTPCIVSAPRVAGRYTQYDITRADPSGANHRIITSLLGGVGTTDNFANVHGTDGTDWIFGEGYWINGVRSMIWGAKVPSWRQDSVYRGDYVYIPIDLKGNTGDSIRIRFGYNTNLFCTTRNEQCSTNGIKTEFAWLSETPNWVNCDTNCTVNIPAYSTNVLYYVVDRKKSDGTIISSPMQLIMVP